jgi:hypothetical protein
MFEGRIEVRCKVMNTFLDSPYILLIYIQNRTTLLIPIPFHCHGTFGRSCNGIEIDMALGILHKHRFYSDMGNHGIPFQSSSQYYRKENPPVTGQ